MKFILLSDIHSNSAALTYLVEKSRADHSDARFCILGDVIGYGPDPIGCLELLKEMDDRGEIYCDASGRRALIGGNHEEAWLWCEEHYRPFTKTLAGLSAQERLNTAIEQVNRRIRAEFNDDAHSYTINPYALIAMLLNMSEMARVDAHPAVEWYRSMIRENRFGPMTFQGNELHDWTLVLAHGTRDKPSHGYLYPCNGSDPGKAERYVLENRNGTDERTILLHGHTHVPMYLTLRSGSPFQPDFAYNTEILEEDTDVIVINPGSVGLPRDHDLRPSSALLEISATHIKTIFLRDEEWRQDLHDRHHKELKEQHYPNKVIEYFGNATMDQRLLDRKCRESNKRLRKRAGKHWTGDK